MQQGVALLSISGATAYEADPSIGYKALGIELADMGMHVTLDTMKHYMNGTIFLVDAKQSALFGTFLTYTDVEL